jgi:hypothetical protein
VGHFKGQIGLYPVIQGHYRVIKVMTGSCHRRMLNHLFVLLLPNHSENFSLYSHRDEEKLTKRPNTDPAKGLSKICGGGRPNKRSESASNNWVQQSPWWCPIMVEDATLSGAPGNVSSWCPGSEWHRRHPVSVMGQGPSEGTW